MTSCLYIIIIRQVEDGKFIFLKKSYHMEKITVVKIVYYLLLLHFTAFFFRHKFFLERFLLELLYFLSFMSIKNILVYNSNTN